jgi:hypothetical protein
MWEEDKIGFLIMCVIIVVMTFIMFINEGDVEKKKHIYKTPALIQLRNEEQLRRYEEIKNMAKKLADIVETNCPDSIEKSKSIDNIEKAVYYANLAIAMNE